MAAVVTGFSHVQAGVCTVSIAVIAITSLYRCLPGRAK